MPYTDRRAQFSHFWGTNTPFVMREVPMRYLIINDDATPQDLREAISNLRAKQRGCGVALIRDELDADVNELLDLLAARV